MDSSNQPTAPSPRRSPGAPRGNHNALKHGFYSREFKKLELQDLEALNASLESEIAALRVYLRRMLEAGSDSDDASKKPRPIDILNGLGLAAMRIASLMRVNAILTGRGSSADETLQQALESIRQEMQCQNP